MGFPYFLDFFEIFLNYCQVTITFEEFSRGDELKKLIFFRIFLFFGIFRNFLKKNKIFS